MKVPLEWLQQYFDKPLPRPEEVARLFTMHAFEVEGIEDVDGLPTATSTAQAGDKVIEFKITPNRAHDCLGMDGIAREFSVLSGIPLKEIPMPEIKISETEHKLKISVEDTKLCPRYIGRIIENVELKESPEWLKTRLMAIGQRPINNVVDITNYVMFATGQPMHAFDLDKLSGNGKEKEIIVRPARHGEKLVTLDGKDIELDETMLVIADIDKPVALAGIKGGKWAEVDGNTKHVILESANFEPTSTRKTSVKVGVRTDSEKRFENEITPELAGRAMDIATAIFANFASSDSTKIGEKTDVYPRKRKPYKTGVSASEINKVLGTNIAFSDAENILKKLNFEYRVINDPLVYVSTEAVKYEGVPYALGASVLMDAPEKFDCSSFTSYLYACAGVQIPRVSVDQYFSGEPIQEKDALPGDLVFSNTGENHIYFETHEFLPGTNVSEGVDHVGIYLGVGEVMHSSRYSNGVIKENLKGSGRFKNIVGFRRMAKAGEPRFAVIPPIERLDVKLTQEVIEEIGRVYGYENIPDTYGDGGTGKPELNKTIHYSNVVREILCGLGFSEVFTYSLTDKGDIELMNPMAEGKKFMRSSLSHELAKAKERNSKNLPLLGEDRIKIFEIGRVFTKNREYTSCAIAVSEMKKNPAEKLIDEAVKKLEEKLGKISGKVKDGVFEFDFEEKIEKLPELNAYEIPDVSDAHYRPISVFPFALRDIAVFVPAGTDESQIKKIIENEAGELLVRNDLFDKFEKDGKISYAFHLVFQSYEKTLSEEELNGIMYKITKELNGKTGWQVR